MGIFNYKEKKKSISNNAINITNSFNNLKETNNLYNKINDFDYTSKIGNQLGKNQTIDLQTSNNINKIDKMNTNINSMPAYINNLEDEF